jgi:hypothetical protein
MMSSSNGSKRIVSLVGSEGGSVPRLTDRNDTMGEESERVRKGKKGQKVDKGKKRQKVENGKKEQKL